MVWPARRRTHSPFDFRPAAQWQQWHQRHQPAESAAPDKPLVSRARSRRTSSSDKPLVRDTAADEMQRQARIASDRDPKRSGGSLGRGSSSGENDREASAAAADPKILKWR